MEVKLDTWRELNAQKDPGDSMDDVIRRACGLGEREADAEEEEDVQPTPEEERAHDAREPVQETTIDDVLDGWRPGKTADDRERRREIGRKVLETLRDDGKMTASDFKDELLPEWLVDDEKPDSWWDRTALPALNLAKEAGAVEYSHGLHEYNWVGRDE